MRKWHVVLHGGGCLAIYSTDFEYTGGVYRFYTVTQGCRTEVAELQASIARSISECKPVE